MRMRFLTLFAAVGPGAALAQSASAVDLSMPPIYDAPPPVYFTWTAGYSVSTAAAAGVKQSQHDF